MVFAGEPPSRAKGDGNRVRHVRRLGEGRQTALTHDGELHLTLGGMAVPSHGPLDLRRGKLIELDAALGPGEKDDAAGVTHQDRRPNVAVVAEELFDDHAFRHELVNQLGEITVELSQSIGHRTASIEPKDTGFNEPRLDGAGVEDDARIAREGQTGIDTEDPHA